MTIFTSMLAGLVFGLGLIISGMANPAKVQGFLDISGAWDPSLAFVMAGAIAVGFFAFRIAGKRTSALAGMPIKLPAARNIDLRLVGGSALFGVGWGLTGFCPGPALVAFGMWEIKALVFVIAMLVGMLVFESLEKRA